MQVVGAILGILGAIIYPIFELLKAISSPNKQFQELGESPNIDDNIDAALHKRDKIKYITLVLLILAAILQTFALLMNCQ